MLGRVDELVVLKGLAGLLVHWVESSFGLCMAGPHKGMRAKDSGAEVPVYQPGEDMADRRKLRSIFCPKERFSGRLPAKG